METTNLCDQETHESRSQAFETLTLRELFPYWSNLLWFTGMRPMLQCMLQIDLTMSESLVLRRLQYQSLTISEVAEYLSITHSAASRATDRLVRDGFISRVENPADRRQKRLTLTPEGRALVHGLADKFGAGIERLVASLPTEEQEQFRLLIAHMVAAHTNAETGPTGVEGEDGPSLSP